MVTYGQPSTDYGRTFITILAIFFLLLTPLCSAEFSEITVSCVWVVAMCGVAWSCYVWCGNQRGCGLSRGGELSSCRNKNLSQNCNHPW